MRLILKLLLSFCVVAALALGSGCKPADPAPGPGGGGGTGTGGGSTKSAKKPKIAFVSNGIAGFWTIAEAGVIQAGKDLDVDVIVQMPAEGVSDQKRIVEDLLTKGVDGLAISPIDPANQTELLNMAAKNTKLITADSDAPETARLVYVGVDNYSAGRMCGQLVKEAMPDGGKLMIFVGRMEQDNARLRRQGVIDELMDRPKNPQNFDAPGKEIAGGKFTILGTLTDQFDRAKGKANVEDTLSRHTDINGMVGLFEYNPPLILEALKQAGKLGKVKVIAFDEAPETLDGIKKGTVHGTVVQNPYMYGYKSVEVLKHIVAGNHSVVPASKFIDIPARKIRRDNVDEFWADLKKKTGQEDKPAEAPKKG